MEHVANDVDAVIVGIDVDRGFRRPCQGPPLAAPGDALTGPGAMVRKRECGVGPASSRLPLPLAVIPGGRGRSSKADPGGGTGR